jgi:hypothetical protein
VLAQTDVLVVEPVVEHFRRKGERKDKRNRIVLE